MGSLLFEKLDSNYILIPILILEMDSTLLKILKTSKIPKLITIT